jgi:hypothetical protein
VSHIHSYSLHIRLCFRSPRISVLFSISLSVSYLSILRFCAYKLYISSFSSSSNHTYSTSRSLGSSNEEPQPTLNLRVALAYAAEHNRAEEVRALLQDPPIGRTSTYDEIQKTLSLAISRGDLHIVELLLQ